MRITLIDDDLDTHQFLTTFLEAEGYDIQSAYNGEEGIQVIHNFDPDLVLLDIQMPEILGWEVCQQIRTFSDVPIMMISAFASEDSDEVRALGIGADDYMTKPLQLEVLKARMQALIRRSVKNEWRGKKQGYVDSHLTIDLHRKQIRVKGQLVSLSFLEYRLLEILARNPDYAVPMIEIIEELWSTKVDDSYARYVRIYVQRLRKHIEPVPSNPVYIVTEHGFGYRFNSRH